MFMPSSVVAAALTFVANASSTNSLSRGVTPRAAEIAINDNRSPAGVMIAKNTRLTKLAKNFGLRLFAIRRHFVGSGFRGSFASRLAAHALCWRIGP